MDTFRRLLSILLIFCQRYLVVMAKTKVIQVRRHAENVVLVVVG
jgi:hypothetical protein